MNEREDKLRKISLFQQMTSIVLVFTTLLFTACGKSANDMKENGDLQSQDSLDTEQLNRGLGEFDKTATINRTVLLEKDGVKITAIGLEYDYDIELEIAIENNSGKNLSFSTEGNSINGYMTTGGHTGFNVADGEKQKEIINFEYDSLMRYGINEISDIEIGLKISDEDGNSVYSRLQQIKTSIYDSHNYEKEYYQDTILSEEAMNAFDYEMMYFSKENLYDEKGIKLLSSGLMKDSKGNPVLLLEFSNTTEKTVSISVYDVAYNDLVAESGIWEMELINPGKKCVIEINPEYNIFSIPQFWEVSGINDIESVSLTLKQGSEDGAGIKGREVPIKINVPDVKAEYDRTGSEVYNSNGIRIVYKAIKENPYEYSSDVNVFLLAETDSNDMLQICDVEGSLSINGVRTEYSFWPSRIKKGRANIIVIELEEDSLKNNNIYDISDITEIEIGLRIFVEDGEISTKNIDKPVIKIPIDE